MTKRRPFALVVVAVLAPAAVARAGAEGAGDAGYDRLVTLFAEWREFQKPRLVEGVPDYSPAAMDEQWNRLPGFRARLAAIDTGGWSVGSRIDYALVRAEMNGLEFDHRVLRPWARDPCFYTVVIESQSDTPLREGPAFAGAIELWRLPLPLATGEIGPFQARLQAIPRILTQARANLTEDARDLWLLGVRVQRDQARVLAELEKKVAPLHPGLVADVVRAREAVGAFRAWIERELPRKKAPSGVGIDDYDWYLRNVHLVPLTWREEMTLMQRELSRAVAYLELEEHHNRDLPLLEPAANAAEWDRRANDAVSTYVRFLREREIMTVSDDYEPALRERVGPFVPPGERDFFSEVDVREPLLLRCHGNHWFDLARLERQPHPSPIRRHPLLYNIWDTRAEGMATLMEELAMGAGLYDGRPRSRELVYVMIAQRAARGIAGLRLHSRELGIEDAVRYASETTPRGWLRPDGDLVWGEQQLYLEQPGYGTSYLTGKLQIESLLAERASQLGDRFTVKGFMDELVATGMIPVALARWETTGRAPSPP